MDHQLRFQQNTFLYLISLRYEHLKVRSNVPSVGTLNPAIKVRRRKESVREYNRKSHKINL